MNINQNASLNPEGAPEPLKTTLVPPPQGKAPYGALEYADAYHAAGTRLLAVQARNEQRPFLSDEDEATSPIIQEMSQYRDKWHSARAHSYSRIAGEERAFDPADDSEEGLGYEPKLKTQEERAFDHAMAAEAHRHAAAGATLPELERQVHRDLFERHLEAAGQGEHHKAAMDAYSAETVAALGKWPYEGRLDFTVKTWPLGMPPELAVLGFSRWETGGGCTAFGSVLKDDFYLLITNESAQAPKPGDGLVIGLYGLDGELIPDQPIVLGNITTSGDMTAVLALAPIIKEHGGIRDPLAPSKEAWERGPDIALLSMVGPVAYGLRLCLCSNQESLLSGSGVDREDRSDATGGALAAGASAASDACGIWCEEESNFTSWHGGHHDDRRCWPLHLGGLVVGRILTSVLEKDKDGDLAFGPWQDSDPKDVPEDIAATADGILNKVYKAMTAAIQTWEVPPEET